MHNSGDGETNEEEVEGTHHVCDACGMRAIKYYKNQNMLAHPDDNIKLDLSKLCKFCIKSCAERRKMTAIN